MRYHIKIKWELHAHIKIANTQENKNKQREGGATRRTTTNTTGRTVPRTFLSYAGDAETLAAPSRAGWTVVGGVEKTRPEGRMLKRRDVEGGLGCVCGLACEINFRYFSEVIKQAKSLISIYKYLVNI